MASPLLSDNQIAIVTGAFFRHFLSFCQEIVVHKQPIATVTPAANSTQIYGYGPESTPL